jgi:hypothetical protein
MVASSLSVALLSSNCAADGLAESFDEIVTVAAAAFLARN